MRAMILGLTVALLTAALFVRGSEQAVDAPQRFAQACQPMHGNSLTAAGLEFRIAGTSDREDFGITTTASNPVILSAVREGSPATSTGLQVGDVLILVNSRGVSSAGDLNELYVLGRKTSVVYDRRGRIHMTQLPAFDCARQDAGLVAAR